jgi:hypothetical protein
MNKWVKAIIFGALVWVVMFVLISALMAYGFYANVYEKAIVVLIAGVLSFIAAGFLKPDTINTALIFGVIFVVVGVILDFLITTRFQADILSSKALWLGYFFILVAPMLKVKKAA